MRIAITGASGFLGSALVPYLLGRDHEITPLVRSRERATEGAVFWDPLEGGVEAGALDGHDAFIHLAGDNIASGRWTERKRRRIRDSRVIGTRSLATIAKSLEAPPRVFVSASAIGFYGDRGDEILTEDSAPGDGFLAEVCRDWEDATRPARDADIRVVSLRFGILLDKSGGTLAKLLPPFKLGAGGRIGTGEQYMSWLTIDDTLRAVHHALMNEEVSGPVNVVSPHPVTNLEFTKTLGQVLGRPTVLPVPAFAARVALGKMADELLLASQRVKPQRLLDSGFEFEHPELGEALQHVLKSPPTS